MSEAICGIYRIALNDGRCYVGQSVDIERRWRTERLELRNKKFNGNPNHYLQNAWNKYGEDAFIFEILEECALDIDLTVREQFWMDTLNSAFNGRFAESSPKSVPRPPEVRAKISVAHLGMTYGPETRAKISKAKRGFIHSDQTKEKMRVAHTGKKFTAEHREKIGAAQRGKPKDPKAVERMIRSRWPQSALLRSGDA